MTYLLHFRKKKLWGTSRTLDTSAHVLPKSIVSIYSTPIQQMHSSEMLLQPASAPKPVLTCSLLGQLNKTLFGGSVIADLTNLTPESDTGSILITFHGEGVMEIKL